MATLFGKEDNDKRIFLSLRKLNFKRNFLWNMNKKLRIIISLDSEMKRIILKSDLFLKKNSIEFTNCSNE